MIIVDAFHYYAPEATHPVLCEVRDNFVWFWDSERAVPMANFPGRFVRLQEVEEPASVPATVPPAGVEVES